MSVSNKFVVIIYGDGAGTVLVDGLDKLKSVVRCSLWSGDEAHEDLPDDVRHIVDIAGDPTHDDWDNCGTPPHIFFDFEDGSLQVWQITN